MWARHREAGFFLGLPPWQTSRLDSVSGEDLEAALRADRQRHNRTTRLAVWLVTAIPIAVSMGISMAFGTDPKKMLRDWTAKDLLKSTPDYDHSLDEK